VQQLPARASATALVVLTLLAVVVTLRYARDLLIPIVIAVLVSYLLNPVVTQLARWRVPRPLGAAAVVLMLLLGAGGGVYALRNQAVAVIEQLPEAARRLRDSLREARRAPAGPVEKTQEVAEEVKKTAEALTQRRPATTASGAQRVQVEEAPFDLYRYLWAASLTLVYLGLQTVVVVFLVFFLLLSGDLYKRKLLRLTGRAGASRRVTGEVLDEITMQIGRFLLVRVAASAVVAVVTATALWAFGLEHAIVWGVLAGIFNTIEYLGPVLVSGGLALVAFLQFGVPSTALIIAGVALLITSLEGWLVTPALLGRATRMNAVAVFVSLLFWGWVWGPLGLVLAVPMMAVIKAVCDRVDGLRPVGELLGD
jgi:predicted PurR-regulated permease PerM